MAADLRRFFGVRLSDMYAGVEDPLEVAHMAAHMPRGGAVGEWYGGQLAITAEVEAIWESNYLLSLPVAKNPKGVKPRPFPDGARVTAARLAKKSKDRADRARALASMSRVYSG